MAKNFRKHESPTLKELKADKDDYNPGQNIWQKAKEHQLETLLPKIHFLTAQSTIVSVSIKFLNFANIS